MGTVCRVTSCCCGCSLRTGALAIGILDLLSAISMLIYSSIAANYTYYWDYNDWYDEPIYTDYSGIFITVAVLSSIGVLCDIFLLVGVSMSKVKLIVPWVGYAYISIIGNFSTAVLIGIYNLDDDYSTMGISAIVYGFCYLAIKGYFILVVWSHCVALREGNVTSNNGVHVTTYPAVSPPYPSATVQQMPYPNAQQPYPSGQQMYPSGQQMYPNGQQPYLSGQQMYPNGQQLNPSGQQMYPNGQQPNPSVQQMYPNGQQPYPSGQQHYPSGNEFYPNANQHAPRPTQEMKTNF